MKRKYKFMAHFRNSVSIKTEKDGKSYLMSMNGLNKVIRLPLVSFMSPLEHSQMLFKSFGIRVLGYSTTHDGHDIVFIPANYYDKLKGLFERAASRK
jgi:hypothetical protein